MCGISESMCNIIGQCNWHPNLYYSPCKGYEIILSVNSEGGSSVFWFVCHSLRRLTLGGTPLSFLLCSLAVAPEEKRRKEKRRGSRFLDGTERPARRMRLFMWMCIDVGGNVDGIRYDHCFWHVKKKPGLIYMRGVYYWVETEQGALLKLTVFVHAKAAGYSHRFLHEREIYRSIDQLAYIELLLANVSKWMTCIISQSVFAEPLSHYLVPLFWSEEGSNRRKSSNNGGTSIPV